MEKKCSNKLKYCEALSKIEKELPFIIQKEMPDAGVYIGKTVDIKERAKEHEHEHGYFYLTPIAQGAPNLISQLEEDFIDILRKSQLRVLNSSKHSTGNKDANILYICFNKCHLDDELCEWDTFLLGNEYPIMII